MTEESTSHKAKAAKWRDLLLEHAASGKSIRVFCAERGMSRPAFQYWRGKFRRADSPSGKSSSSRFVAISRRSLTSGYMTVSSSRFLRMTLPNGVTIDFGVGLDSPFAKQFLLNLCGVGLSGGPHAKS